MNERIERVRARLSAEGIDALLIEHAPNRRYLSGFTGSAGALLITLADAYFLTDFRYVEQAAKEAPDYRVVQTEGGFKTLKETVASAKVKRVAFDAAHTTVKQHRALVEAIEGVEWTPIEGWVEAWRAVKDDRELARMSEAAALADRAFLYIIERLEGRSEREVAFDLETFMRKEGAERPAFRSIVASGENGALPHANPTDRVIGRGDMVTLDFGAVVDGYCSDLTRTVVIKEASERQKEIYDLVLRAQEAGVAAVRPGRTGAEVDAIARGVIEEAGHGEHFGHGLGHGVGLEVHENPPVLAKRGQTPLAPGMVTSVEPGVYIPGWGGVRIEDLVVVTAEGCRVLSHAHKEMIV